MAGKRVNRQVHVRVSRAIECTQAGVQFSQRLVGNIQADFGKSESVLHGARREAAPGAYNLVPRTRSQGRTERTIKSRLPEAGAYV